MNLYKSRRSASKVKNASTLAINNILWLNSFILANYLNGLIIGIWVIRSFSPNGIGLYGYANSATEILASIAGLGITDPLLRELAHEKGNQKKLLATTTIIYFASSILLYLCLLIFAASRPELELKILLIVVGLKVILKFSDIYKTWYLFNTNSKEFVSAQIAALLVSSSIKAVAILGKMNILTIAFADLAGIATIIIILEQKIGLITTTLTENMSRLFTKKSLELLKQGLPLLFSSIFITLNLQIDTLLVKQYLGLTSTGLYIAATKIPIIIPGLLYSVEQTLLPINLKSIGSGADELSVLKKTYSPIIYASLLMTLFLSLLSNPIINLFFGPAYKDSAPAMAVLASTIFIGSAANVQTQYCLFNSKSKDIFKKNILIFCLNIALDIILIQSFGLIGGAIGTSLSLALGLLAYGIIDKKFSGILVEILVRPDFSYISILYSKIFSN